MNEKTWKTGDISWIDLMTTDPEKAKTFYTEIFGWNYDNADTSGGTYFFSKIPEGNVGGLTQLPKEKLDSGMPSYWNTYAQVDNVDQAAVKAKGLGGKILAEPFNVMDAGRMAVIASPSGAVSSIWQSLKSEAEPRTSGMNHGMYGWVELGTNNVDQDGKFYCNLFNWSPETQDMPTGEKYTSFKATGTYPVAGMMTNPKEAGDMPSAWAVYFTVNNMEESVAKIKASGGKVIMDPFDVPKVGKMGVFQDPTGAYFCTAEWDMSEMNKNC